uniref:Large ribosomal subunit protein bL35m n=1 Tax=Mandrillus leucophaeus TaxID=9568 RepID=A0A2K5YRL4_MANLE
MAASTFARAVRVASVILWPLNILASSAYRNCVKNTPVVSSTPRLTTSERNLTCEHTSVILNRVVPLLPSILKLPVRSLTYLSIRKGKRKIVKAVIYRFLRLHCGLWKRRAGYKKKLWKKAPARKKRLREFIFCNKTQSKLLRQNDDKYHDRTNLKV